MKTQRLLVVDDNLSLIHMIREHAKNSGKMEVLYEAHDGEEGFRMIKNHANENNKISTIILTIYPIKTIFLSKLVDGII